MKVESYLTAVLLAVISASSVANGLPSAMNILNTLSGIQNPQPIQPALNSLVSQLSASILPSNVDLNELISTLKDTNKNLDHLFKLIDNGNQVFQNIKDYLNPPKPSQPVPIQYGATGGGILTSLRSTLVDKESKTRQTALLNGLFDDSNNSHGDIINVNQIVIASNDSSNQAPMINVDEIRLIYQLIDMFDMSKLISNESNRRMMLTLLERFQVPKENLVTIELLANLSKKLNESKKRTPAVAKEKAVLPSVETKILELVQSENKTRAVEQDKPDKKKSGKDKSMKLIQNRRDEMFQRILDLKNRRKLGEQPSESVVEVPESAIEVKEAESSALKAVKPASEDLSGTLQRSVRALTASANENDPFNMFLKNLVSEEVVKQYKWMFDFFQQLQKIRFQ